MRKSLFLAITIVSVIMLLSSMSYSAVPQLMNYQGRLTDTTGKLMPDGNYSVTFRFYGDSIGPSVLWQEGQLVTVKDGLFQALLGGIFAFPADLFESPNRWLGVQVGLSAEMQPRTRLMTMAYAFNASCATHSRTADTARNVEVSACYHRIAFDSVGGSVNLPEVYDDTTWIQAGSTISIPSAAVRQYIFVTVLIEGSWSYQQSFDIRIGAAGQEQSRLSVVLPGCPEAYMGPCGGTASTLTYYYEPSDSEKSAGFNVRFFVRGFYGVAGVRKADIFGL